MFWGRWLVDVGALPLVWLRDAWALLCWQHRHPRRVSPGRGRA